MNNQVAINFLDQVRKILLDDKSWLESTEQPINEAFDMAISALQAQDLQPACNQLATDVVSRQAAINECNKRGAEHIGYAIAHLPSAQPELSTEIQEILNYLDTTLHPIVSPDNWDVYAELHDMVSMLPSAQHEREYTMEEFMVGQDMGNPEDGSL